MKKILTIALIVILPCWLKAQAQNSQLGKSKEEIRKELKDSPLPMVINTSESDTHDIFYIVGDWQWHYYYKSDTCYKIRMIFPYGYKDGIQMQLFHDPDRIKLSENTWTDSLKTQIIKLTPLKRKNQLILEFTRFQAKK